MPDYRLGAPSVDFFTTDEQLVLRDWLGVYPRSERWIKDILDVWNIPEERCVYFRQRTSTMRKLSSRRSRIATAMGRSDARRSSSNGPTCFWPTRATESGAAVSPADHS
jgi:hypothetical protein